MKTRPYGECALLCEVADFRDVPGLSDAAAALEDVVEVVAGARTLLVVARAGASLRSLDAALAELRPSLQRSAGGRKEVLDVSYDGPDLDEVAELSGLSRAEVVAVHSGGEYTVRFCGFVPGFAYLDGLDERLQLPRRGEPRTKVLAGSVGVADEFTGVYPRASPGGWRLLGRTEATLWDADRDPPALLAPGTRVRFRAT